MGPLIDMIKEAAKSNEEYFQLVMADLGKPLSSFLEKEAFQSSQNAEWAISKGESLPSCIACLIQ